MNRARLRRGRHDRHRHVLHFLADYILHALAADERNGFSFESFGRVAGHIHLLGNEPMELSTLRTPSDRHEHPQDLWNFQKGTPSRILLSMGVPPCVRYTRLVLPKMILSRLLKLRLLLRPN